ncbi:copper resistance protein CopC [Paenibacillus aurantius]|uniref:Copper resistance protein CopC n=1 Tax=Paenibacillus aurantius TaxID=2918900 RepID=A0AA96LDR3_9BACL|nr:copper resistance protein CopC [Paenibacillus aurantius]WNQ10265.1 copper resistance protein CopC [Paenibacillus aurantius]
MSRKFGIRSRILGLVVLLLGITLGAFASEVSAHAGLTKAVPEADSQMEESPPRVELTFNERIEEKLFTLKVIDEIGRSVTPNKPVINSTHTSLTLDLPQLHKGIYVVSYHVISADGHPVDGSYVITVGPPRGASSPDHAAHEAHELSWSMSPGEFFKMASRFFYYAALLAMTGFVLWMTRFREGSREIRDRMRQWSLGLQRVHLISLMLLIYTHYADLLGEDGGLQDLTGLFTGTTVGLSWLASLALSLLGFVLLHRKPWLNLLWVAALIGVKSVNGHAMAFEPQGVLVLLDAVHLAAAALWAGGLVVTVAFWKQKGFLLLFLKRFSRAALGSILLLALTGVLSTFLFLPKISYVLYSQWGILLLVKAGLVVMIAVTGALIRSSLRKRGVNGAGVLLKVDLSLMAVILGVVALLTYLAPVPPNEPLAWHVMGTKQHMSAKITPNIPGTNTFTVKVWLPEQMGPPKQVILRMINNDDPSIAPIVVPVKPYDDKEIDTSFDMKRYSYKAEGPYLPFPGSWTVQVRVLDSQDDEIPYEKIMRVY